jgi:hypothetical protein
VQSAVRIAAVVHAAALTLAAVRAGTRDYPQAA